MTIDKNFDWLQYAYDDGFITSVENNNLIGTITSSFRIWNC